MTTHIRGKFDATGKKFGLVAGSFNEFIVSKLVDGAIDTLVRHGASVDDITVAWTPGAFEIPVVARRMVDAKRYDAVIALGCVIRGGTPHFDYVAGEAAKGVGAVAMNADIPVQFGILTTDTIEQAIERAGTKAGNKGAEAAMAAIEMVDLLGQL